MLTYDENNNNNNNNNIEDNNNIINKHNQVNILKEKFFNLNIIYDPHFITGTYKISDYEDVKENLYNIELFELINKDKCIHCKLYAKCFGHCILHINKLNLKQLYKFAHFRYNELFDTEKITMKISLFKKIMVMKLERNKLNKIYNFTERHIKPVKVSSFLKNIIDTNKDFIKNNVLQYTKLVRYYKNMLNYVTDDVYRLTYDVLDEYRFNLKKNIMDTFKYKQQFYEEYRLSEIFSNKHISKIHIDNSDILLINLLRHELLITQIHDLEREKLIVIDKRNFRADIYLELMTRNVEIIPVIIEVDEDHHSISKQIIDNDCIKDKYYVLNGYSVIRIELKTIVSEEIIKDTINKLVDVIELSKPVYYFSDNYINTHKINKKEITGINIKISEEQMNTVNIKL